jgi:hypothetical protein
VELGWFRAGRDGIPALVNAARRGIGEPDAISGDPPRFLSRLPFMIGIKAELR